MDVSKASFVLVRTHRVLQYARFLADFYGASIDALHVLPEEDHADGYQAGTTYFQLLYRSSELRWRLDRLDSPAVRAARLIIKVGHAETLIHCMMRTSSYQLVVTEPRMSRGWDLTRTEPCGLVGVPENLQLPIMSA